MDILGARIKTVAKDIFVLAAVFSIGTGLILNLSGMPVGFIAMVPPTLYDLDIDLANACWLLTNGLLVVMIPLLMFILYLI